MESVGRCKLCGTSNLGDKNLKLIDDFLKQVFNVILLKLTFEDITKEVICKICFSKLLEAFDFKSTCLDTEDIIFRYLNSERSKAIDLKEIYAMEKMHVQEHETLKDWEICRLCFQPVRSKTREIQDVPLEIIQIYIPEINFAVTTNALVCTKCFESLYVHSTFIKSCSAVEDKSNILAEDILLTNSCIKTEEIEIKSEETDKEESFFEIPPNVVKKEEIEEGNASIHSPDGIGSTEDKCESSFENHENDFSQTKSEKLVPHQPVVNNPSEVEMFKCDKCKYESKCRKYFVQHELIHRDPSEMHMHKCDKCTYESKFKYNLKQHQLIHKDTSEVEMFKCDKCGYETKWKKYLGRHKKLVHSDPLELRTYKCDKCKYESKCKKNLVRHGIMHKDPLELRMYKCDKCMYESKFKSHLLQHLRVHQSPSQVEMFKCDQCKFESKHKKSYALHQLKHKDPSEVKMFKCDECGYETKIKWCLVQHQLTHKDAAEVKMFKCDKCKFETKYRHNLNSHQLVHKDASELQIYKCLECKFVTKRKKNYVNHQLRHRNSTELVLKVQIPNQVEIADVPM